MLQLFTISMKRSTKVFSHPLAGPARLPHLCQYLLVSTLLTRISYINRRSHPYSPQAMTIKSILKLFCLIALAFLVVTGLGPAKWAPRSGLGFQVDHFAGFLVLALIFCVVWARPIVVAAVLIVFAVSLEAAQALTTYRSSNAEAAFYSACGVLAGALIADLSMRAWRRFQSKRAEARNC